jgi:type I restriction-modification system DNA methylase subunit
MGVEAPHRNRYLFSDHYLENILPDDPRWEQAREEAEDFLTWLQDLYADERDQLPDYNESQLEQYWFQPILEQLGHVFELQASVPGLEEHTKRPDYVFFPDDAARQRAASLQNEEDYAAEALAVGEVKRWNTPLGKKRRGGDPVFEDRNPSWQIDYYIRATGLDWGILTNGRLWRLVHTDTSQRLQIYYEVDLVQLLEEGDPERVRYFTLFFRQAAFQPDQRGRIFLDDALAASNAYAIELEEDLEENVYQALERLMQGFLDLPSNNLTPDDLRDIYDNSLYLLYRLLFILYGESRGLLPLDNDQYRRDYSLTRIKNEIAQRAGAMNPRTTLYWGQIENLFHIINGDDAELNRSLGVPRYDGGLFNPDLHPFLEEKEVGDQALVTAIDLLSRRETEAGREFADYRTLGVRHLGSIYEGLLEYQPRYASELMVAIRDGGEERWVKASEAPDDARVIEQRAPGEVYLETDRGERKATGSYYTPQYIVEYIVKHTLGPLVERVSEAANERGSEGARGRGGEAVNGQAFVEAILDLKCLDPAMGSGHFLVEATEFLALELATDPYVTTEETAEEDLTYWKRRVVERCIYGVDKNPLAVELAKLSLWLATVATDRPLSFLDHHLKCGDSLIGARVEDLGWAPPPVLSKRAQKRVEQQKAGQMNMFEHVLSQKLPVVMGRILEITEQESRDYDTVRAKEAADQAVRELKEPFEAVADLWTSGYFGNAFEQGDYDEALGVIGQPETLLGLEPVKRARQMADERRFFHWELAFPEVFYDEHGQPLGDEAGFDAVVGNPPYERTKEFIEIQDYLNEIYNSAHGAYDIYVLFVEQSLDLLHLKGRLGYIVSNKFLVADYGKRLRNLLYGNHTVQQLVDLSECPSSFPEALVSPVIIRIDKGRLEEDSKTLVVIFQEDDLTLLKKIPSKKVIPESLPEGFSIDIRRQADLRDEITGHINIYLSGLTGEIVDKLYDIASPLSEVAYVRTGVMGFQYWSMEPLVSEGYEVDETRRKLLPPSLVGRYRILWGQEVARLYKKELKKPIIRHDSELIDDNTWDLFISPKVIVCGVSTELAATYDAEGHALLVAMHAVKPLGAISHLFLTSLINSNMFNWFHLIKYYSARIPEGSLRYPVSFLKSLPIRRIEFTTPADERERLAAAGIAEATEWIEAAEGRSVESASFSAFSDSSLGRWLDARLSADPEQADVVHDLLAHLAERMIEMHEQKQERVESFWLDLEGVTDPDTFEDLREHGKWGRSLWRASEDCRPFVGEESRSTRHLDESLGWNEDCFKAFVKALAGRVANLSDVVGVYRRHHPPYRQLVQRIEATDRLIDQIVYRLYGLTEEEIAVVEGSEQ